MEAIKELEHMSLTRYARMRYEEHLKSVMDRKAQDAYVYDQGQQSMLELIKRMNANGDADKVVQLGNPNVLKAMMKKYGIE